jgi:hypothetical protein
MRFWGTRLTWTTQREHASQNVRGMQLFYDYVAFMTQWDVGVCGLDGVGWLACLAFSALVIMVTQIILSIHFIVVLLYIVKMSPLYMYRLFIIYGTQWYRT